MKKIVICTLLLCLLLAACAQTNSDDATTTTATTTMATTTKPLGPSNGVFIEHVRPPFFTTGSMDEYQVFVDQHDLPEHFVPYEKLSFIAPFNMIEIPKDPAEDGLEYYYYMLKTDDGFYYGVEVMPLTAESYMDKKKELDLTLTGNLRTIDTKEEGYIRSNNAFWHYDNGKLELIGIQCEQVEIHILPVGSSFYGVNETHHEIMQNLLHADTAGAAVQAFMDAVGASAK